MLLCAPHIHRVLIVDADLQRGARYAQILGDAYRTQICVTRAQAAQATFIPPRWTIPKFLEHVGQGNRARNIVFEITERAVIPDYGRFQSTLSHIAGFGHRFASG